MMPYQAYQLYQIERPKSRAEISQADEQLGRMAESVTALREGMAQGIIARSLSRGASAISAIFVKDFGFMKT